MTERKIGKTTVFVVSDAAGETGESVVRAATIQFEPSDVDVRRVPYVLNKSAVDRVIRAAKIEGGIIAFTLVLRELREYLAEQARKHDIVCVDLLGPMIASLEKRLDRKPRNEPGAIHQLDEQYFKKIEAVEFAVKYDDGRDPLGIAQADIVLIGVSRTSKTPLSMYLANKAVKVANVPLVPELKPPDELFMVPKEKVIGLKISPEKLNSIRKERLKALGLASDAPYANTGRIRKELAYAEGIMTKVGCVAVDVSNKAVEETANVILELLRGRR